MHWTRFATSRDYRRHQHDTGETAVDTRHTRRDQSRGRVRSSSIPRVSFLPARRRTPSPAPVQQSSSGSAFSAPSCGPRPRSTSPHNKQDYQPVNESEEYATESVPVAQHKAPPPIDEDIAPAPKPYAKPPPAHLAHEDAVPTGPPKAKPPPANLDTTLTFDQPRRKQRRRQPPRHHRPGSSKCMIPGTTTRRISWKC